MSDDAEALGLLQAAGGGDAELVRAANQQVTCGGVAAALGANIRELWELLRPDGGPQGCREGNIQLLVVMVPKNPTLYLPLLSIIKPRESKLYHMDSV